MKKIVRIFGALLLLWNVQAWAGAEEELTSLMQKKVGVITSILRQAELDRGEQDRRMQAATDALFDYRLMGMLSLGKPAWSKLSAESRETYLARFEKRVKESYMDKLHLYTDEEVVVEPGIRTEKNRIHVPSKVLGKDGKMEILYKFYPAKGGKWLIYDVEISGVSIIQTYRAQFDELLKTGTPEELVEKLEAPASK